jgi:phosphoglycerol geranylgeranyltransferase
MGGTNRVVNYVCNRQSQARHAILIDPADQSPAVAAKRAIAAVTAGSRMILVGGSTGTDMSNVHNTIIAIQESLELINWAATQSSEQDEKDWKVPVVLFPQGASALSPAADAITFMMLMNSTSPQYLIEEQVIGAPFIKKAKITPLSMGYLVCAPGGRVGQVGQVDLIKPSDTERVSSYAITAEFYGFKMLYLEAGSGAAKPVSSQLIETARDSCDLTIIVGGGIRDGAAAKTAVRAGADWIITGNLTESYNDADELQNVLSLFIEEMNS